MEDYYEILKIDRDASLKDIKKAYAKLVRQYPPETHPEEFKKIRKAYEALINGETYEKFPLKSDFKHNINTNPTIYNEAGFANDSFYKNEFEIEINPQSDYKQVLKLYKYYYNNRNYQKAIEILNLAIDRKNTLNSNNTIYYIQLITAHASNRDLKSLNDVLYEFLKDIQLSKGNTRGEYIFNELKNLSIDIYNKKEFKYAQAIAYMLLRLNPKDKRLNSMLSSLSRGENSDLAKSSSFSKYLIGVVFIIILRVILAMPHVVNNAPSTNHLITPNSNYYYQPINIPNSVVIKKMTLIPYGYKFKEGTFGYTIKRTGDDIYQRAVTSDEDAENLLKQYNPAFLTLTYTNGTSIITLSAIITVGTNYINNNNLGTNSYEISTHGDTEFCYVDTGEEKKVLFRESLNGEGYKFMPDSNKNLNRTPFVLYTITSNSNASNARDELVVSAESLK